MCVGKASTCLVVSRTGLYSSSSAIFAPFVQITGLDLMVECFMLSYGHKSLQRLLDHTSTNVLQEKSGCKFDAELD